MIKSLFFQILFAFFDGIVNCITAVIDVRGTPFLLGFIFVYGVGKKGEGG